MAEVLITLGIIGIVAALTIPNLISSYKEHQYKTAYKKAYSDLSQVFITAIGNSELTTRTTNYDKVATESEWSAMKKYLKVIKECTPKDLYSCWNDGDKFGGMPQTNAITGSFVDASGRSWTPYYALENIYLVDTNGFKAPNQFGKDRFPLALGDKYNNRLKVGDAVKVIPIGDDQSYQSQWCNYPPCHWKSWLIE